MRVAFVMKWKLMAGVEDNLPAGPREPTADGPILVVGFGKYCPLPICPAFDRYCPLPANPASKLVENMSRTMSGPTFDFLWEVEVSVEAPMVIARRAMTIGARAIVVFGVDGLGRGTMRLEESAGRRADCWLPRLKGVRARLKQSPECLDRYLVDPRFLRAAQNLDDVDLGDEASAGKHICNWTFYRLAADDLPVVLVHLPLLHRRRNRLRLGKRLLRNIDREF